MIDIKLKIFKEDAVDFLFSKTTDSNSKPRLHYAGIRLSGKTIILVAYIEKYLDFHKDSVIVGFVGGRENLKSNQERRKMERLLQLLKRTMYLTFKLQVFESGTIYFINWNYYKRKIIQLLEWVREKSFLEN